MATSGGNLLMTVQFPAYTIKSIGPKYFVIGGGGGSSNTGVSNILEIFELYYDDEKKALASKNICKHSTGKFAVMNCGIALDSLRRLYLACGHDDKCYIYTLKQKVVTPRPNSPDGQLRKRKSGLTQADDFKNAKKIVTFDIQMSDNFKTDFSADDPYQSCAAFSSDGNFLATAGGDGHIRMWKYPELTQVWEVKAHDVAVDDLHVDPTEQQVCSTSRDGKLALWKFSDGEHLADLKWKTPPPVKYRHKACRFCRVDGDPRKVCLFSIEVPAMHKKGAPCYISQWDINTFQPIFVKPTSTGILACMDISDDGKYLGVGAMEGEVSVYSTRSLQCVYYLPQAHKTFVTGVAFAPSLFEKHLRHSDSAFTMLSISVDNQVKAHCPTAPGWRRFFALVFLACFLIVAFVMIAGRAFWEVFYLEPY